MKESYASFIVCLHSAGNEKCSALHSCYPLDITLHTDEYITYDVHHRHVDTCLQRPVTEYTVLGHQRRLHHSAYTS